MYGYLSPYKPELKVKEEQLYKAFYCGLCRYLKHNFGQVPRLTVQYDMAVMALFVNDFIQDSPKIHRKTCVANPIQKHPEIYDSIALDRISALNVIMFYRKLLDDINDNGRFISKPAKLALNHANKKAEKIIGDVVFTIDTHLHNLNRLEYQKCSNMDEPAHEFGKILESFVDCFDEIDTEVVPLIKDFCYNIGKWVYLVDAIDDYDKDTETGNYNPLIQSGKAKDDTVFLAAESCRWASGQASEVFEKLQVSDSKGIIENILYIGMPNTLNVITDGKVDDEELL